MACLKAISLSVIARSQQNTEGPYNIGCRKYNLVVLLPDAARSVTAIVTKAITIIWRCMCCCNRGTHLMHCIVWKQTIIRTVLTPIPSHPTHSKRPYITAVAIYRHAAGEKEKSYCDTTVDSLEKHTSTKILFCWPCSSIYWCKEKNQLDAHLILSILVFRQPLHVSGVSRPIIRRYNTTIGT